MDGPPEVARRYDGQAGHPTEGIRPFHNSRSREATTSLPGQPESYPTGKIVVKSCVEQNSGVIFELIIYEKERTLSITTLAPDTRLSDGGTDDEDGVAHYAKRSDIMQSAIEGTVITALCGYKLRQRKDGDDMPKCQKCVALLYALI